MNTTERIVLMRTLLEKAFAPTHLEIIDDSGQHVGHAGNRHGAGYYTLIISAPRLINKSRVDAHREIYAALGDLMQQEIHALVIKIIKNK